MPNSNHYNPIPINILTDGGLFGHSSLGTFIYRCNAVNSKFLPKTRNSKC